MSKGDAEYRRLSEALANAEAPACTDDPRFILEPHEIAQAELTHISVTICRPCPLRDLCRAYAAAARPTAGIWAGKTYAPRSYVRRHGKESA